MTGLLEGKTGLIMGIANKRSIAWGIANSVNSAGARLLLTYQNERLGENVRELAPLMKDRQASIVTLTYLGSERVIQNYNVMGVAKAALEASVRYLANDLGPHGIRVNAISAGPIKTLASSAVGGISNMIKLHAQRAPLRKQVDIDEVGDAALFLVSPLSRGVSGEVIYVDGGYHILGV